MAFNEEMRRISKPVDMKGLAGILAAGSRTYRGGLNNPVSGPRTIPGGFANMLQPVGIEKRGRPTNASKFRPEIVQAYLDRRQSGAY